MRQHGRFFLSYLHPEPPAPAATAAVAEQIEQDHAPAPAHQPAGLGVGGLGAVGLAGILHPAQVHLVFGVIGVQLHLRRMQNPGQTYRTQTTYAQPGGLLRWCWSMILLNLLCNCCCGGWGFRGFRM